MIYIYPDKIAIGQHQKLNDFPLLGIDKLETENNHTYFTYNRKQLIDMTLHLMRVLEIAYDPRDYIADRKLEDFSEDERKLYYPFAFMLACLAGNAFRNGHSNGILENGENLPDTPETISQYIPDAYHIIKANSGNNDEVKKMMEIAVKTS